MLLEDDVARLGEDSQNKPANIYQDRSIIPQKQETYQPAQDKSKLAIALVSFLNNNAPNLCAPPETTLASTRHMLKGSANIDSSIKGGNLLESHEHRGS